MSAVYPSDEPDEQDNPNTIIDRIIDQVIGGGEPDDVDEPDPEPDDSDDQHKSESDEGTPEPNPSE